MSTREEYALGMSYGCTWADEDRSNYMPASETLAMLREEAQTDARWARAFYLGALRGYRAVCRTELAGRWGT